MNNFFNINELNSALSKKADNSSVHCEKYLQAHMLKINSIKNLVGKIPDPDEIYFLWTLNSFNAFTFIPYTLKHAGTITNLSFSTYSINERIVSSLVRWHDKGELINIHIVIADSIRNRMPKVIDLLDSCMKTRPNIRLSFAWNHSKITLLESAGNYFVVEGSGNFSENARYEQYIYVNNKNIYEFRKQCIGQSIAL